MTIHFNLQRFAEGESGTAGESGAVDAAQQLLDLGVPAEHLPKKHQRANKFTAPETANQVQETQQDAAVTKTEEPAKKSWDEIMADPDYNKSMQETVSKATKKYKGSADNLDALRPAIELLSQTYGLNPDEVDFAALNEAIINDENIYEDMGLDNGVTAMEARSNYEKQRAADREQFAQAQQQATEQLRQAFATDVASEYPDADFEAEMQNPLFQRYTTQGFTPLMAYEAIHRQEVHDKIAADTTKQVKASLSRSIQSGQNRPAENGSSTRAASVSTFDYSKLSRAEKKAFDADLERRLMRGETVRPY